MRIINKYKYRLAKKRIKKDEFYEKIFINRLIDNVFKHGLGLKRYTDDQLQCSFRICCILNRFDSIYDFSFHIMHFIIDEQERRLFSRDNVINFGSYANDRKR